jgi:glycine oxidase
MEPGRDDTALDQAILAELRGRALAVRPDLAARPWRGAAGVRMATPDRLPLAGPVGDAKILVAAGARRNGWLFGPLVAEILLAYLTDGPVSAAGARLAPERFGGPAGHGRGDPGATEGPARA